MILLLIQAFKESVVWGLVYLLVPFGALVYIVKYWDQAKDLFLKSLIGGAVYLAGIGIAAMASNSL